MRAGDLFHSLTHMKRGYYLYSDCGGGSVFGLRVTTSVLNTERAALYRLCVCARVCVRVKESGSAVLLHKRCRAADLCVVDVNTTQ